MHNDIDRDLYEILGVSRAADNQEIKNAYRNRALECHPDVAQHDPESELKFKELTFAYEILSDEDKRRDYDRWGLEGLRRSAGVDSGGFSSFSDLIEVFFGGGGSGRRRGGRARTRGRDMESVVSVTLAGVLHGIEKEVEVGRLSSCEECGGTGRMPGTHASRCSDCGGTGQVTSQRNSFFGTFVQSTPCRSCGGAGEVVTEPCRSCGGAGRKRVVETIKVSIPPGVEHGDHMLVRGKGEGGLNGGPTGDLYIGIDVQQDPLFERSGTDLHTSVAVDMIEAALGTELEMSSFDGDYMVKVPAGTQPGDVIKVKGKGLPPRGGGRRGSVLVRVDISVPTRLTGQQRKLLEQMRDARKEKVGR